ncbi:MAG: primosomal protein N' [Deltaproteobacteria bacterium]|nr:primosomal protein N' [Deltaproteobacteria bacterium]
MAVALPVWSTFDYTAPPELITKAKIGCRVLAPFGRKKVTGYIIERIPLSCERDLRDILDVLDEDPLFQESMTPFFQWMAEYYMHPLGRLIGSALPGGLNIRMFAAPRLTEKGEKALDLLAPEDKERLLWVKEHPQKKAPIPLQVLYRLQKQGLLLLEYRRRRLSAGPLLRRFVRAGEGVFVEDFFQEYGDSLSAKNERTFLEQVFSSGGISVTELCARYSNGAYLVKKWVRRNILEPYVVKVVRDPAGNILASNPPPLRLYPQQKVAAAVIREGLGRKTFSSFLLHGVTGSGKTEVYYQAVKEVISLGRQAILMTPEIALTVYIEGLFRSRLGQRVALYHSGLSDGERYDQWMKMARGEVDLVIGARSALFAPLPNLGLIIVDEEHDTSYKQEEAPRYQARDAAVVRGKIEKALVLLGSGTPSIQSFYNAHKGRYGLLRMPERIENRPPPEVEVVDMRSFSRGPAEEEMISPVLKSALDHALTEKNQAMLFLNRRGFTRVLLCRSCGQSLRCANCDVPLTFHLRENHVVCHYCGFRRKAALTCPICGRDALKPYGFGTEKVEKALAEIYPGLRIERMDRDSVRRKGQIFRLLKKFSLHETDVLIGTQMITKGYDFPRVTLVGVLAADFSLGFPDFRAAEKTFQILSQVAGRAGRGEQKGRVIVQTFYPEHYAIAAAKNHDYQSFFDQETELRQQLNYPPFSFLACLRLQGNHEGATSEMSKQLAEEMARVILNWPKRGREIHVLGPVEAPLARLRGKYRWQIFVKSGNSALLHRFLYHVRARSEKLLRGKGVDLIVDIDPYQML